MSDDLNDLKEDPNDGIIGSFIWWLMDYLNLI